MSNFPSVQDIDTTMTYKEWIEGLTQSMDPNQRLTWFENALHEKRFTCIIDVSLLGLTHDPDDPQSPSNKIMDVDAIHEMNDPQILVSIATERWMTGHSMTDFETVLSNERRIVVRAMLHRMPVYGLTLMFMPLPGQ